MRDRRTGPSERRRVRVPRRDPRVMDWGSTACRTRSTSIRRTACYAGRRKGVRDLGPSPLPASAGSFDERLGRYRRRCGSAVRENVCDVLWGPGDEAVHAKRPGVRARNLSALRPQHCDAFHRARGEAVRRRVVGECSRFCAAMRARRVRTARKGGVGPQPLLGSGGIGCRGVRIRGRHKRSGGRQCTRCPVRRTRAVPPTSH